MGDLFITSTHIYLDTCIIFALINPTEIFHQDCSIIANSIKIEKKVIGFIHNIVEEEFNQIVGHRFNVFLEKCLKIFKKSTKKGFKITHEAFTGRDRDIENFFGLIFHHLREKGVNLTNFYELLQEIEELKTIIRKKYILIVDQKNGIQYRNINKERVIEQLERRVNEFTGGFSDISRSDRRIIVYYEYLTDRHPYSGFLTFDGPILKKRCQIREKEHINNLNIINPTECLYILNPGPEYEELVTDLCKGCFKVLDTPEKSDLCESCLK